MVNRRAWLLVKDTVLSQKAFAPALDEVGLRGIYEKLAADSARAATLAVTSASILRAARILAAAAEEVLADFDLTVSRFEVLGLLNVSDHGRLGFGELKQIMFIHPATMGHTIKQLEAVGLIRRETDDTDRRAFFAVITAKGRRLAEAATDAMIASNFGVEGLSESAARSLVLTLADLRTK